MMTRHVAAAAMSFGLAFLPTLGNAADAHNMGAKECKECHEAEYEVWKSSPHFKAYKSVHKSDEAKKITKAMGIKRMKKDETCTQCHYTLLGKPGKKPKAKAGPSCESCHNPASVWMDIHNDYGGPDLKAEDESPAHKAKRLADAEAANMIASRMGFDMASNCLGCHALSSDKLDKATLNKLLEAGHPVNNEFELVSWSQGELRHRFTPPDTTTNNKLDAAGIARLFISGQAAALVAAKSVMDKSANADFQAAHKGRMDAATKALKAISGKVPEAKALLASPNADKARKLVAAIKDMDLSGSVSGMIPAESDYK